MTLEELRVRVPELNDYLKYMPDKLNERYWIHTYPPGTIIHQMNHWNTSELSVRAPTV